MTDIKTETGSTAPHPMMRPSPYDQRTAFDRFIDLAQQIAAEVPEDKRDGETVEHFGDSVLSDFVANALTVLVYDEDTEMLDAVFAKAIMQAAERKSREDNLARVTPAGEA